MGNISERLWQKPSVSVVGPNNDKGRDGGGRIAILATGAVLVGVDFYLGPMIQFPVLFVLPVMWAAWAHGMSFAILLSLGLATARFVCHWWWDFPLSLTAAVVNNVLRAAVLMVVAVLVANVGALVRNLRRRVAVLEARLSVCEDCGVIREEDGAWRPVEADARVFPRVRCPRCEEKRYGLES